MTGHDLKCWPEQFEAIRLELKIFEFRKNDRGFEVGDTLHLKEWDPITGQYTRREMNVAVPYIMKSGFGLPEGYCIMSISLLRVFYQEG